MQAYATTDWLEQHLRDPNVRVLEASIAKETYDAAHVPGAQWIDFHKDLLTNGDDTCGDILTPDQYTALMRRLGIASDTTVVWYGDRHSSYAIRGFWTMDFYQHPAPVHVLEGGRERWLSEGRPVTTEVPTFPAMSYPTPRTQNATGRATWQQVRDAIGTPDTVVLDVRARAEYEGTNLRAARGGHVPGAVNIEWTDATAGDNVLKSPDELRAMYEGAGITREKEIIAHCQLGIRAVHTWFVLKHVLGYPNVRNYDGSWQEWGNRSDSPIER